MALATACALPGLRAEDQIKPIEPPGPTEPVKPVPAPGSGGWGVATPGDPTDVKTEEKTREPEEAKTIETPPAGETPAQPAEEIKLSSQLADAVAAEKKLRASKKNRYDEIIANYKRVLASEENNAEAWYRMGLAQARGGDYKSSFESLDKALSIAPDTARYLNDYGTIAMYAGDVQKAFDLCSKAVQLEPTSALYVNALANVFLAAGQFEKASELYKQAIKKEPRNSRYIHNLARCKMADNKIKDAIPILDEVIRLNPESAEAYNDRGIANLKQLNRKNALSDFINAVRINPEYADAHHNLAILYSDERDPRFCSRFDAVDHARAACKLTNNRNPTYLMGLAEALRANHDYEKALVIAKGAVALDPSPYNQQQLARFEKLQRDGYSDNVIIPGNANTKENEP